MFDESAFWARAEPEPNSGCLLWPGAHSISGYGRVTVRQFGGLQATHRLAFVLTNGPIPKGFDVCHTCDITACMNPDHLFLGTRLENMRDAVRKGRLRGKGRRTECRRGHPYTPDNVKMSEGRHGCRVCIRAAERVRRAAKRKLMRAAQ